MIDIMDLLQNKELKNRIKNSISKKYKLSCEVNFSESEIKIIACEDTDVLKERDSIYIRSGVFFEYETRDFTFDFCLRSNCLSKEMSKYISDIYNDNLFSLIKDTITVLKLDMYEVLKANRF